MPLIDDDGNLFGGINVIDALVIVMLLAVLVAGAALVTSIGGESDSTGEAETRYATFELGQQPDYVVDRLSEGDVATLDDTDGTLTVTDVYVTPAPADAAENATTTPDEDNATADDTATDGPTAGTENETTTIVTPDTTVQPYVTIRAEFNGVPLEDQERELFQVGGEPLLLGTQHQLNMGSYATNATVTDLGHDDDTLQIDSSTTDADVELRNVSPPVADALEDGMTETVGGETTATVDSIEREPATVIVESEDGDIYEREHPQNEDVTVAVELETAETDSGVYYRGDRLGIGSDIVLDFERVTVDGTVIGLE